jgi:hypothetical protein
MDIIAIIMIIGCVIALIVRPDSTFKDVLLTITGLYFGRKTKLN